LAGVGFDASVWETWAYLTAGASLHVVPPDLLLLPRELVVWMAEQGISHSFLPTPLAEAMMEASMEALLAERMPAGLGLRALLTGGDRLRRRPAAGLPFALVNHYGPTESTVVATAGTVAAEGPAEVPPSIGRPIANTRVYLLNRHLQPMPPGSAGELYIGGDGLARAYLGRPALTAEKLVPDPFGEPGARLYRTGDLARFGPGGELEFLGRLDDQVKIRGFRIELGEVEAVLCQHPAVREAVVMIRHDQSGSGRLVAYLTWHGEAAPEDEELQGFLNQKLPSYMVPSAFVPLDLLPLTANGKIDREALPPPPIREKGSDTFVAPRSEVEALVAEIWCDILNLEQVGVFDNFFELGGHSLQISQIISRVRDLFEIEIPPRALFESPTVAGLTFAIAETLLEEAGEEEASEALSGAGLL
jgi:acyl-CoA synthetase (AMP-forming)/AMP-acid ligase II/acyl carrier protein